MRPPKVSVIMPVYNGEKYLRDAIKSVLFQYYRDFEFIIIDDGSKDKSAAVIGSFSDSRIKHIKNEKNTGLVNVLNLGLEKSSGEYIMRMDADDISHRRRFAEQVKFMDQHKSVGACGSFYHLLLRNKKALADFPVTDSEMRAFLLFNSPIAHPSSIIRKSVLEKNNISYSQDFIHAEDYDLWSKISGHAQLANIPKSLLTYRVHAQQVTHTGAFADEKNKSVSAIRKRHLEKAGISFSDEELLFHNKISNGLKPSGKTELDGMEKWLQKLVIITKERKSPDPVFLQKHVLERWLRACINHAGVKKGTICFYQSELYGNTTVPLKIKTQLLRNFWYSWKRKKIKDSAGI